MKHPVMRVSLYISPQIIVLEKRGGAESFDLKLRTSYIFFCMSQETDDKETFSLSRPLTCHSAPWLRSPSSVNPFCLLLVLVFLYVYIYLYVSFVFHQIQNVIHKCMSRAQTAPPTQTSSKLLRQLFTPSQSLLNTDKSGVVPLH